MRFKQIWGRGEFKKKISKINFLKFVFFFLLLQKFLMNFICFVFLKKMMYYTLTLITIFSVISPIFRTCFLQHYYINTLYRHMPYSTVMKLNIIYSCAKGHTTTQFFFFFVIGRWHRGKEVCMENGTSAALCDAIF